MTCRLPGGYVDADGIVQRDVELRALSGREEELLADQGAQTSAALVTAILSRCVRRIGAISPVPEEVARGLLVADRQYLLIKLREATFGRQVQATIVCPWPDCGHKMDIDFTTAAIPVRESEEKGPFYPMTLSPEAAVLGNDGERHREVLFRLPNGGDQEALSPLLAHNEAQALTQLLARCIQRMGPWRPPDDQQIARLSPRARAEIEQQMALRGPQIDLTMEADCPECQRAFAVPFDLQGFFFGELRISRDLLYREVHYLAYHYHWSEREIMEMAREKRRNYIAVLAEEIERLNDAI